MPDFDTSTNFHTYVGSRRRLEDFFESEKALLLPALEQVHGDVLDIGCASGGLFEAIAGYPFSSYLGLDVNQQSIAHATQTVADRARFVHGNVLDFPDTRRFELVNMFEILFLFEDYRRYVEKMFALSDRYVHFTNRIKLQGATELDMEKSNVVNSYLGPQKLLYIVFNLGEFLTYLCDTFRFESVAVFGYEIDEAVWRPRHTFPEYRGIYPTAFLIDVRGEARRISVSLRPHAR